MPGVRESEINTAYKTTGACPLVSVCIITYNHEHFIRRAIESVLCQETIFSFEIIIAEDCSTDNTRKIIQEYADNHPAVFRLVLQKWNVGPGNNFIDLLKEAKGKYIAYFEGDDYWTDTGKLQKQVAFMEDNPQYVLTFHNVDVVSKDDTILEKVYPEGRKKIIQFIDLVKGDYTKTCASIFRNDRNKLNLLFDKVITPDDTSLYLALLDGSSAYYFEDTMAAYRIHAGGVWSTKKKIYQLEYSLSFFEKTITLYKCYPEVNFFKQQLNAVYVDLATENFLQKKYGQWAKYAAKSVLSLKWSNQKIYWNSFKTCVRKMLA